MKLINEQRESDLYISTV